jgi:hypothetical protein
MQCNRPCPLYPPKADMCGANRHVVFGSKADICGATAHVRFTPNSDIDCVLRRIRFAPQADIVFELTDEAEFGVHLQWRG